MSESSRNTWDAVLARRIKSLREEQGRTQQWLADEMRRKQHPFHQATIYKIETGERRVSWGEAVDLADALNADVAYFAAEDFNAPAIADRRAWTLADNYMTALQELDRAAVEAASLRSALIDGLEEIGDPLAAHYLPLAEHPIAEETAHAYRDQVWSSKQVRDLFSLYGVAKPRDFNG